MKALIVQTNSHDPVLDRSKELICFPLYYHAEGFRVASSTMTAVV